MTRLLRLTLALLALWLVTAAGTALGAAWEARHGLSPAQYQSTFTELTGKGYRLKTVSGYLSGGSERYAALWVKESGPPWAARHGLTAAQYQAAFDDFTKKGYRLVYVSGHAAGGQARFAAIWEKSSGGAWTARHNLSAAQYQSTFTSLVGDGYRLRHVNGYTVAGKDYYAAIWEKGAGPAWAARHQLTAAGYQQAFTDFTTKGYRLRAVSGYEVGGSDRYAALWEKAGGPLFAARHGIKGASYQDVFDNFAHQGYEPVHVNAFTAGGAVRFNGLWENKVWKKADLDLINTKVAAYMKTHDVPGLTLAITKDGRLVYAAGFGVADKSTGEPVGPSHRFRVASVSKPITAVAIMRLLEQNKISSLDKKVFGSSGILGKKYATPKDKTQLDNITVRQLLQHIAGFTNSKGDPMFEQTSLTIDELIESVLANKPLNTPGSVYEYSNFGFSLLGRIVEQASGLSYEKYVRSVLATMGITRMEIAANTLAARKEHEVVYYPSSAYNLNVSRFDAHGGWIATAVDLVRFMVRVDGLATKPDVIGSSTWTTMTTKAGVMDSGGDDPNYAMGWVAGASQRHNGCMTGTLGWVGRTSNGFAYGAAINTRPSGDGCAGKLKTMIDDILGGVSAWPGHDLF